MVHRVTTVSPTASSSYLSKKLKQLAIPYIIGPLNGGVPWPKEFIDRQHQEKEWLSHIRNLHKLLPGYKTLRRNANAIIVGSQATKNQMPDFVKNKLVYLPENAIDPKRFSVQNTSNYDLPIKAAFTGRLVPYKGADMAIKAMEQLCKTGKMIFDIYGTGPEEQALKELIQQKGLDKWITMHGFVEHTELQQKLVTADIFVFPSIREFGGGVILEAMTLGIVPIIANYAGPSELVTETTGYKVPIADQQKLINNFKTVLEQICESPEQLITKRQKCIETVEQYFTWQRKAEQINTVYDWVMGQRDKPDLIKL